MEALELIVDEGRPANAGRFFQLGTDLLSLLDELSDIPVAWRIEALRTGSAVARVAPPFGSSDARWLRLAVTSLSAVQAGLSLSHEWSPDAIKVAHRFVAHGLPQEDEAEWAPPRLVLVGGTENADSDGVQLTAELGSRLADLQPFERRMPGSVRGTLVGLNVSRGNRASLRLQTGRIVRVGFESAMREDLRDAMLRTVELRGSVRQDADGRVFHVRAEEVEVLARPDVRWSQLFGLDPGFTGDLTTGEYLEASRGEA